MMAARMPEEGDDFEKNLGRLQELFHGRFDKNELEVLLGYHENGIKAAATFILQSESSAIRRILEEASTGWTLVTRRRRLKRRNPEVLEQARQGQISCDVRQFSCAQCDRFWWRKIPTRKPVSKCRMCKTRVEAVPKNREWGWGKFKCTTCNREFEGWGQMNIVWSPCYQCGTIVYPYEILPPSEMGSHRQRTRNQHCCGAPGCIGRNRYMGPGLVGLPPAQANVTCVHPASRSHNHLPMVVHPSNVHMSSGSTVDTFLTQDRFNECPNMVDVYSCLESIHEEDWLDEPAGNDE